MEPTFDHVARSAEGSRKDDVGKKEKKRKKTCKVKRNASSGGNAIAFRRAALNS